MYRAGAGQYLYDSSNINELVERPYACAWAEDENKITEVCCVHKITRIPTEIPKARHIPEITFSQRQFTVVRIDR